MSPWQHGPVVRATVKIKLEIVLLQLKSSNDSNKTIKLSAVAVPIVLYRVGSTEKSMLGKLLYALPTLKYQNNNEYFELYKQLENNSFKQPLQMW